MPTILYPGTSIVSNNLLATIPSWGPTFRVTFDLYINSFVEGNQYGFSELLRFTATDNNFWSLGDAVPVVLTTQTGIHIVTQIGSNNHWVAQTKLNEKTWYHVELVQHSHNNKKVMHVLRKNICNRYLFQFVFEIKIDGAIIKTVENQNPTQFSNVTVWNSRSQNNNFPPADAVLKNIYHGSDTSKQILEA